MFISVRTNGKYLWPNASIRSSTDLQIVSDSKLNEMCLSWDQGKLKRTCKYLHNFQFMVETNNCSFYSVSSLMKSCLRILIFEDFLLRIQSLVKRLERIISSKYPKMVLWCWLAARAEHIWYEHGWMCGAEQSSHTSSYHIGSGGLVSWRAVPAEESEGLGGERD